MRLLHVGWGFLPFRYGGLIQYAEDLMHEQVARGHDVAWFCAGRHYPLRRAPRLKRWSRDGVRMYELQNTTLQFGGHRGTPDPQQDLDHPPTERLFEQALDEFAPDVVHVQELLGLPSSVLTIPKRRGIPVVMTLEDYFPLCPTIKLWDADDNVCLRREPGEMCAVCCRDAPTDPSEIVQSTLRYYQDRLLEKGLHRISFPDRFVKAFRRAETKVARADAARAVSTAAPPAEYDTRRAVNVERLSQADLLIAMSTRVAEIYEHLGVDGARLRTMQLTLRHIAGIAPKRIDAIEGPVRFVAIAGFGNVMKGGDVLFRALELLEEQGLTRRDLVVDAYGYVEDRYDLSRLALVEYRGFYAPGEMDAVLAPAHVGIVPSVWEEAYGYVGVELLAKGIPVVANAVGGVTDYVRPGETGWLNERADAEGLAAILTAITADRDQIVALNERILERRDEIVLPLDDHVDAMDAVYAELAG